MTEKKKSESEVKPFRLGDICKYLRDDSFFGPKGKIHIIGGCQQSGPDRFGYSTSVGAWVPHSLLELVSESSPEWVS